MTRQAVVVRCQANIDGEARHFDAAGEDLLSALGDLARQIHEAGGCRTPDEFVAAWLAANPNAPGLAVH